MLHPSPKMSHIIFKSCQRRRTGDQNASQKLTLGSSGSHFSCKICKSCPFQNAWYAQCFRDISQVVAAPFADCMRKENILTSWSQLFSAWVVPREGKFVNWGTQSSPKTPKAAHSDAPRNPKLSQKATLGLHGVPRVPPEVSGAPSLKKKSSK